MVPLWLWCSSGDHIPKVRWSSSLLPAFGVLVMPYGKHKLTVIYWNKMLKNHNSKWNQMLSYINRFVRNVVPTKQGSGVLQLPIMGVGWLRYCVCILYDAVRPHEAVRSFRQPMHRSDLLHNCWDPSPTKGRIPFCPRIPKYNPNTFKILELQERRLKKQEAKDAAARQAELAAHQIEETDDERDDLEDDIEITHF